MTPRIAQLSAIVLISFMSVFLFVSGLNGQDGNSNPPTREQSPAGSPKLRPSRQIITPPSSSYTVLYSFCTASNCADGNSPSFGALLLDSTGNLYGTTLYGGSGASNGTGFEGGSGTVFELAPTAKETVLHSFCSDSGCADGSIPYGGNLVEDAAGNLYGTTQSGGVSTNMQGGGGTIFTVDKSSNETVLYDFCSLKNCTDGSDPLAGLFRDTTGNLYGTTGLGGSVGVGTVFELSGIETVLYNFDSNSSDGLLPNSALIQDSAGNFYGTTNQGPTGGGTLFELSNTGVETLVHTFCSLSNCPDGLFPLGGLIRGPAGNFYGTTEEGGANGGGTVFEVTPAGQETVLYSFCSATNCTDGKMPYGGLVFDSAENLYGTTFLGGANTAANGGSGGGTLFKLDTTNHETVLYSFCSLAKCADGEAPTASLIFDTAGNLYGTTSQGGANTSANGGVGGGVIFKFDTSSTTLFSTTTSLTSSVNPAAINQTVTYTATVKSQSGKTVTGTINFIDGTTTVATVELASNRATYSTTYTKTGTHSITATYSGDASDSGSTSPVLTEYIETLPVATATTVSTSGSPSMIGQSVTFAAAVACKYGTIPNGETVTFYDGPTSIGTSTTASQIAKFTTSTLAAKTHTIKATYAGDATFKTSSGTVQQVVDLYATTTTLNSSLNPTNYGQSVTLTAVVKTAGTTSPTGKINFDNGTTSLGTAALDSTGKATLTTTKIPVGSDSLTAIYAGDTLNAKSTSSVITQVVKTATIKMSLTSSPNPSTVGQSVKFTATLTSNGGLPTGSGNIVTFTSGGKTLGTGTISATTGIATFSTTSLLQGSNVVTASYAGNTNYAAATAKVTQKVD